MKTKRFLIDIKRLLVLTMASAYSLQASSPIAKQVVFNVDKEITLRTLKEEDSQALFNLAHSNANRLNQYMPGLLDWYPSEQATRELIAKRRKAWKACQDELIRQKRPWHISKDRYILELGIWYKEKLIGWISLHDLKKNPNRVQIGYWLDQDYAKRNIMTKSCIALVNYAFQHLPPLKQIDIWAEVNNKASNRVAQKLLFQPQKTYREDHYVLAREDLAYMLSLASQHTRFTPTSECIFFLPLTTAGAPRVYTLAHANKQHLISESMRGILNDYQSIPATRKLIKERAEQWKQLQVQLPNMDSWPEENQDTYIREFGVWHRKKLDARRQFIGWTGIRLCKGKKKEVSVSYWTDKTFAKETNLLKLLAKQTQEIFRQMPITHVHFCAKTPQKVTIAKKLGFKHLSTHSEHYYIMQRSAWQNKKTLLKEHYILSA